MSTNVTLRISEEPDFRAYAFTNILEAHTILLDKHTLNAKDEVVLHGWSSKTIDFWMTLLHSPDMDDEECLAAFDVDIARLWSIVSFYEMYVRPKKDRSLGSVLQDEPTGGQPGNGKASSATLRLRDWFGDWWKDNAFKIREIEAGDLALVVTPALYIGDARVFMEVTHYWFLHTQGRQSSVEIKDDPSDKAGQGTLPLHHPMLGKLAAVRSNMIGKLEDALAYDEESDGLPREKKDRGRGGGAMKPKVCQDPDWCPKEKTAAYYTALMATGCWPVGKAMQTRSLHKILSDLQQFDYISYHKVKSLPDRAAARAKMPRKKSGEDSKLAGQEGANKNDRKDEDKARDENTRPDASKVDKDTTKKPCNVCIDAAVEAAFDRKVTNLFRNLLDEKQTTVRKEVRPGVWSLERVDDSFKGLCLDCLTKTKFESEDDDYWSHCHNFEFDHGCTVKHGQPTWYFSYMGRPEAMQKWAKTQRG